MIKLNYITFQNLIFKLCRSVLNTKLAMQVATFSMQHHGLFVTAFAQWSDWIQDKLCRLIVMTLGKLFTCIYFTSWIVLLVLVSARKQTASLLEHWLHLYKEFINVMVALSTTNFLPSSLISDNYNYNKACFSVTANNEIMCLLLTKSLFISKNWIVWVLTYKSAVKNLTLTHWEYWHYFHLWPSWIFSSLYLKWMTNSNFMIICNERSLFMCHRIHIARLCSVAVFVIQCFWHCVSSVCIILC